MYVCVYVYVYVGGDEKLLKHVKNRVHTLQYSLFKHNTTKIKTPIKTHLFIHFHIFNVFPKILTLELTNKVNGPQIRIRREISSLQPAPKVWKPKSRSSFDNVFKNLCIAFQTHFNALQCFSHGLLS